MAAANDRAHRVMPSPGAQQALEEALRSKAIRPIESVDEWASDGIFESDKELDEFLDFTRTARRTGIA
jgi:hypothetical protein